MMASPFIQGRMPTRMRSAAALPSIIWKARNGSSNEMRERIRALAPSHIKVSVVRTLRHDLSASSLPIARIFSGLAGKYNQST